MIELLNKYQLLLSFLKVSTIDSKKLESVFNMFGVKLDPNITDIIVSMLKEVAIEKKVDSVGKLLLDPDISSQLVSLIGEGSALQTVGENKNEASMDSVHLDSLIECTHCHKRVHVRSAVAQMK